MKKVLMVFMALGLLAGGCSDGNNNGSENGENHNAPGVSSGSGTASQQITAKGSDTQLPLTQQLAEEYMKQNKDVSISVVGGGSGVGISALQDGTTDIAMSSRDLKTNEKLKMQERKLDVQETVVAYDALAVVVNPSNPVKGLTREQLEGIFTGKITNWKEVGGKDMKIVVYSRESSSGTYEFFKEHVMDKKNYASNILSMSSTGAITTSIKQTEGAIGYVGLAYVKPEAGIKALEVSYDGGKTFVAPTIETSKNKTYPVSRPLYYFFSQSVKDKVQGFLDFSLSAEGQKIVEQVGYIPVK